MYGVYAAPPAAVPSAAADGMERRAMATATTTTTTTTGATTTTRAATGTTSTGKLTARNTVEDGMAAATKLAGSAGLGATATTMTKTNGAHGARMDRLPTI